MYALNASLNHLSLPDANMTSSCARVDATWTSMRRLICLRYTLTMISFHVSDESVRITLDDIKQ